MKPAYPPYTISLSRRVGYIPTHLVSHWRRFISEKFTTTKPAGNGGLFFTYFETSEKQRAICPAVLFLAR